LEKFQNEIFETKIVLALGRQFFALTNNKNIAEFTTLKFFTFNDFFHFADLNWSLKDVKHTIMSLQKQLIFNKYRGANASCLLKPKHLKAYC